MKASVMSKCNSALRTEVHLGDEDCTVYQYNITIIPVLSLCCEL